MIDFIVFQMSDNHENIGKAIDDAIDKSEQADDEKYDRWIAEKLKSIESVELTVDKPIDEPVGVQTFEDIGDGSAKSLPKTSAKTVAETELNGIPAEIVVGESTNVKPKTQAEIDLEMKQAKERFESDLKEQVDELESTGNYNVIDTEDFMKTSDNYNTYVQYLIGNLYVPSACGSRLTASDYINGITQFKYNPYDSPNVSMQHTIPENVVLMHRLNKLLHHEFVELNNTNLHFDDMDTRVCKYLMDNRNVPTTKLEYTLIKSFLGKLMISLSTTTEMACKNRDTPLIDTAYKQAIARDLAMMKTFQIDGKLQLSWDKFVEAFLGIGVDNYIYRHDSYDKLNERLKIAYNSDFLTELLVANTLKCYIPSISINYFYAIKSMYITARLISIYINKLSTESPKIEDVMNGIKTIVSVGCSLYEIKSYVFKQMTRTLPSYTDKLEDKTEMYIVNHLFTGGQYYLLKMIERAAPVIASLLPRK